MAITKGIKGEELKQELIRWVNECEQEAKQAKFTRMQLNKENYRHFQLEYDFSHKRDGQSQEILAKQRMAVLQISSFFQQALADLGEWFKVVPRDISKPEEAYKIKPHEIQKLMGYYLDKIHYFSHVGKAIQAGLLGGLIVSKIGGKLVKKPKFRVRGKKKSGKFVEVLEDRTWELSLNLVRQEDYYPDPTGRKLYEIETYFTDLYEIKNLARGKDAIYDAEEVNKISTSYVDDTLQREIKQRESIQNLPPQGHRPRVKITEFIGNVLNNEGEIEYENVHLTVANDKYLIRGPVENLNWSQESDYVAAPLLDPIHGVWPIALMDAPTRYAKTLTEFMNLILDAAFKQVHAPSQIRVDDLEDPAQVSDGIPPGIALRVKSTLPPGAKVMEPLTTVDIPSDSITVFNLLNQEFNASALTNDLRQGVIPFRQVKATEVVEASQTITSIFQGVAKNIESTFIEKELNKVWYKIAQNFDLIDDDVLVSLFGSKRGRELSQLDPQDVFVETVSGFKFQVFGISRIIARSSNFQKYMTFLQVVGGSDVLLEEFVKKYSFEKLLGEIISALNLDANKIALDQDTQALNKEGGEQSQGESPLDGGGPGMALDALTQGQIPNPEPDQGLAELFAGRGPEGPPIPNPQGG